MVKTVSLKSFSPSPDGGEQVLSFHLPGEIIGLDATNRRAHPCSAKVLETSAICEIPFQRLEELTATIPGLQQQLYRLLSKETSHHTDMLLLLGKKSAEERRWPSCSACPSGCRGAGCRRPTFIGACHATRSATIWGSRWMTVSRLFTRFQDDRLLGVDRKHIELFDLDALETLADGM